MPRRPCIPMTIRSAFQVLTSVPMVDEIRPDGIGFSSSYALLQLLGFAETGGGHIQCLAETSMLASSRGSK